MIVILGKDQLAQTNSTYQTTSILDGQYWSMVMVDDGHSQACGLNGFFAQPSRCHSKMGFAGVLTFGFAVGCPIVTTCLRVQNIRHGYMDYAYDCICMRVLSSLSVVNIDDSL